MFLAGPKSKNPPAGKPVPVYQYDPGYGKGSSVPDSDHLPSGIGIYPSDSCFKWHVWPGRCHLRSAGSGLYFDCFISGDLHADLQKHGTC